MTNDEWRVTIYSKKVKITYGGLHFFMIRRRALNETYKFWKENILWYQTAIYVIKTLTVKKYLLGHSLAELVCNFVPDKKTKYYVYTITTHRNRAD